MAAVVEYGKAAVRELTTRGASLLPNVWTSEAWVRLDACTYRRQSSHKFDWYATLVVNADTVHGLPEFSLAMAELEADAVVGPQLDEMVGSGPYRSRLERNRILDRILASALHGEHLRFREEDLVAAYLEEEARLYATTEQHTFFAPLVGVVEAPAISFGDVELGELSEPEADALLDAGLLQVHSQRDMALASTRFCLRMQVSAPKVIGDDEPMTRSWAETEEAALLRFEQVLGALRLLADEPVVLPVIAYLGDEARGWRPVAAAHRLLPRAFKLTHEVVPELKRLVAQVSDDAICRKHMRLALVRLGFASERHRVEDRLVDIVVAAEALFMGGEGDDKTELTYKISSRFAHFADLPKTDRRERFELMKRIYGIRSKIVHGAEDLPEYARGREALEKLLIPILEHLRWAIRKMLDESERQNAQVREVHVQHVRRQKPPKKAPVVDWNSLLFGEQRSAGQ